MARGRPRQFDTDEALDAALALFWRHGYDGTSLAMLSEAMGVNVPSIYAAFGNKEALFARAVDRYIEKPASYLHAALGRPTARQVAASALDGAINMVMQPGSGDGCLLVHGALASGPGAAPVRAALATRRTAAEKVVCGRFQRAIEEGDLPADGDAAELACYLMTVIWGLSVQAAGGASRRQLEKVAELVMRAWPGS